MGCIWENMKSGERLTLVDGGACTAYDDLDCKPLGKASKPLVVVGDRAGERVEGFDGQSLRCVLVGKPVIDGLKKVCSVRDGGMEDVCYMS